MSNSLSIEEHIETIGKAISLLFKVGVLIGGAVLLFYSLKIGHFPSSVTVGDGLLFILVAVAFSGVYTFFTVCLTSLGLALRPLWHGLQWLFIKILSVREKVTGKRSDYTPFVINRAGYEGAVFSIFGALFIFAFGLTDIAVIATLLFSAWGCAFLWSHYQDLARRVADLNVEDGDKNKANEVVRLKRHRVLLLVVVFFIPLLIGGVSGKLVDGAMRLVGARTEGAVVHLKSPYDTYATIHELPSTDSPFGQKHKALEGVTVLFRGFGTDVVLQATDSHGQRVKLTVPVSHAHIIERQHLAGADRAKARGSASASAE